MHPAKSVILFTTASGAGYGLIVVAVLAEAMGLLPRDPVATLAIVGVALALIVVGLGASTFHLGRPERAWRALSQWRSSWLSREGVAAVAAFVPIAGWGALRYLDASASAPSSIEAALAGLAALSALVVLYCTGMIYASLKAVPMWATPWTPIGYLLLGPATGGVLLNAIAHALGFGTETLGGVVSWLLLAGLVAKLGYWKREEKRKKKATPADATGLGEAGARVQALDPPHSEPNYLMREMGFQIARKHAGRLRRIALVWTFVFPMLAILMSSFSQGWAEIGLVALSLVTASVGLVAERYLFFAEAKHVQSLYYGEAAV
ncbi:MAG: DmsC/YnfH family molybdoenzyme membrane anchor subunit [Marivibrio sp.]|uniref:dimethyl sulfoxide reductase anchor subunit family protein n=1 Tax=Marivibrio sp. TaxID=2039719 RepID=UPI0032EABEC2